MMKEIPSYLKSETVLMSKAKEMNETDSLVKDTGGQEVQSKVLQIWRYREKGMQKASLFLFLPFVLLYNDNKK